MVKVLLAYLVVLVPLNWALFWLLGRVEWAWIAAPLIAVACAVAVVWLAQLDIGFARAHTGIAVVELQSGYPRATSRATRCSTVRFPQPTPFISSSPRPRCCRSPPIRNSNCLPVRSGAPSA